MSLPPLWMVVDDEMNMVNLHRLGYLQRFDFNFTIAYFTDPLFALKYYKKTQQLHSMVISYLYAYYTIIIILDKKKDDHTIVNAKQFK
ncbi:MAG: hypothetical protein ACTHJ7_08795 [Candidatus Nitrosocosmicus sp.]